MERVAGSNLWDQDLFIQMYYDKQMSIQKNILVLLLVGEWKEC